MHLTVMTWVVMRLIMMDSTSQSSYTFNGTTKIGGGYGESRQDADAMYGIGKTERELWTVGVYHDVNSWLKVIAEYSNFDAGAGSTDTFSLGGFLLW